MKKHYVISIVLFLLCLIQALGIKTIFKACPAHDGTYMSCHWAEQAVLAFAIALTILSLLALIAKSVQAKKALCLSIIPLTVLSALIPGKFITLCMMADMRCISIMKPAVQTTDALIGIFALAAFIIFYKQPEN